MAKKLLAVEDSKTMRKVLGITFATDEFEAVVAESPQQALSQLDQLRPDMVLLDVTLGETNGYDLCRQVKSRAPGTPVIILSSRQQPYDPVRGAEVQADDFIDKPFDTQQMRDKVKKLAAQNGARPAAPVRPAAPAAAPARPAPIPRTPPPAMPPPPTPGALRGPGSAGRAAPPPPSAPPVQERMGHAIASSALAANGAALKAQLEGLELTRDQVQAVLALSRDVIERVVWEVVPVLAETLIKEEIQRLTRE
ncbi:MAG TPA: response regulator [Polyangiaceae bacterium]|nr:response regulator [Polyangiaceae bacterium]